MWYVSFQEAQKDLNYRLADMANTVAALISLLTKSTHHYQI